MRLTEEEFRFIREELVLPDPVRLGALNAYRNARRHFKRRKRDCFSSKQKLCRWQESPYDKDDFTKHVLVISLNRCQDLIELFLPNRAIQQLIELLNRQPELFCHGLVSSRWN